MTLTKDKQEKQRVFLKFLQKDKMLTRVLGVKIGKVKGPHRREMTSTAGILHFNF